MIDGWWILIPVFALGASFVQRVTGFGFGIFIMTVLPFIMPSYGEATALSGLLALISAIITTVQMRKFLEWRKLWLILLSFCVASFVAIEAVGRIDSHLLRRMLGAVLILISVYYIFFSEKIKQRAIAGKVGRGAQSDGAETETVDDTAIASREARGMGRQDAAVQVGMGALSGVMGGFFAMQGPPAVIHFLSCADSKEEYMALISAYFVVSNTLMTVFRAGNGFVTAAVGKAWIVAMPCVLLGLWFGTKVYRRLPASIVRKVVYGYMAVAGAVVIILG